MIVLGVYPDLCDVDSIIALDPNVVSLQPLAASWSRSIYACVCCSISSKSSQNAQTRLIPGICSNNGTYSFNNGPPVNFDGRYTTDHILEMGLEHIEKGLKSGKPFFAGIAPVAPHCQSLKSSV